MEKANEMPMLTVYDAAAILNVSSKKVWKMLDRRQIPFFRMGRMVRIKRGDLDKYIEDCRVSQSTQE